MLAFQWDPVWKVYAKNWGEKKDSQCEPKTFRTGSVQAMLLHKTCCSSPAETSTDSPWGAEGDRAPMASLPCSSGLSVGAHCWCSSALSAPWPDRNQPFLPSHRWICCSLKAGVRRSGKGTWRWARPSNFSLQMSYKHKCLKEVNKTVVDRERCTR